MKQLWQRIFAYFLALILVFQLVIFALHKYSEDNEGKLRFVAETVGSLASAMDGQSLATARAIIAPFNRNRERVWLEDEDGRVLAGERLSEFFRAGDARPDEANLIRQQGDLLIWESPLDGERNLASRPLKLSDVRGGRLYMHFRPPGNRPDEFNLFLQGLLVMGLTGIVLVFWMARRVSRPLRRLRGEVLEIAGGSLEKRVTEQGEGEIADVATAVNQMADSLSRHIRGMRELVANISHELRSPLARMQVALALLEENLPGGSRSDPARAKAKLALLHEELEHMEKLIGTTLLSSKLDLQEKNILKDKVALSELCTEMCRREKPLFNGQHIAFTEEIEPDITLDGDETLLCNLVANLLDNAAKYAAALAGQPAAARLRLSLAAGEAVLEVENSHPRLEESKLEQIFEPFNRAGIATGNGVGLGLYLVRQVTLLHGGSVCALNTPAGIAFRIALPL
ncbi:MAG: HAMP domain-containing histidine kinase [Deltaproteobacteria bacterium]|jgi:two-component system sensor histidine kinase CpxA|nr:HAMP domain-containing histidine kinase [Deltaproteobacteria bacterium]